MYNVMLMLDCHRDNQKIEKAVKSFDDEQQAISFINSSFPDIEEIVYDWDLEPVEWAKILEIADDPEELEYYCFDEEDEEECKEWHHIGVRGEYDEAYFAPSNIDPISVFVVEDEYFRPIMHMIYYVVEMEDS